MKHSLVAALLIALSHPPGALADDAHHKTSATTARPNAELSEGEVRKVDKETNKITIRHGPLKNLDMPAMTMVFQVKDLTMLDQVKAGDKIRFSAEKTGGAYTVTTLEPAR